MTTTIDPRVTAIRENVIFGAGSCSPIDECYTDSELTERLDDAGKTTIAAALQWARQAHDIWVDRMDDAKNAGSW